MAGVDPEIEAYVHRAQQALEVARGNFEELYWIDMFDERQITDYEVLLSITEERARMGLEAANQFVVAVTDYLEQSGLLSEATVD